jgi:hypothetical protein
LPSIEHFHFKEHDKNMFLVEKKALIIALVVIVLAAVAGGRDC